MTYPFTRGVITGALVAIFVGIAFWGSSSRMAPLRFQNGNRSSIKADLEKKKDHSQKTESEAQVIQGITGERFNSARLIARQWDEVEPIMTFNGKTEPKSARHWQASLRRELEKLLGGISHEPFDIHPEVTDARVLETRRPDGSSVRYTRETVVLHVGKNAKTYGYFLKPLGANLKERLPCILCLYGHPMIGEPSNADELVGLSKGGKQRDDWAGYQQDVALQCVANGYCAFVPEQLGIGRRSPDGRVNSKACHVLARHALLFGKTLLGMRINENMRCLDYLSGREDVDPQQIYAIGISGGGRLALYTAALDERVRKTAVFGSFADQRSWGATYGEHCLCELLPGHNGLCTTGDIGGLLAPRFLYIVQERNEKSMDVKWVDKAYAESLKVYRSLGKEDRIRLAYFDGSHGFYGKDVFRLFSED